MPLDRRVRVPTPARTRSRLADAADPPIPRPSTRCELIATGSARGRWVAPAEGGGFSVRRRRRMRSVDSERPAQAAATTTANAGRVEADARRRGQAQALVALAETPRVLAQARRRQLTPCQTAAPPNSTAATSWREQRSGVSRRLVRRLRFGRRSWCGGGSRRAVRVRCPRSRPRVCSSIRSFLSTGASGRRCARLGLGRARRGGREGSRSRITQPPRSSLSRMPVIVAGCSPERRARALGLSGPWLSTRFRQSRSTSLSSRRALT